MKSKIEFFYDCSSPWTYLAFSEIENLVSRQDLKLIWKPILVGGVFNSSNPSVKAKQNYSTKDLQDWSKIRGLTINWPDVFPVNSVKAMRGAFYAINKEMISEYSSRVFFSYWTEGNDISQDEVLIEIISSLGFDSQDFFSFIELDQTKELLKSNTQELIDRGGFGSPTIFIDENNMFFGNARLKLIEEILQGPS